MTQPQELSGAIVPLVTPFDRDEAFDPRAMKPLVDHILEEGADALMATALTGEGPLLEAAETLAVWDAVFEQAAGRAPVVPAVIATTTRRALDLVRAAEARGAAAVMAAPILPELYAGRSHDDVHAFYSEVASAASLPIVLFNYPSLTGIDFTPALLERLASIEAIRFIKESSGDARRVHAIQRRLGERLQVICGAPNTALESLALGCRAWITGIMNAVPRSARQLMRALDGAAGLPLARRIYYEQILPLVDVLTANNNPTGTIKAAVEARGTAVGRPRRPGQAVDQADRKRIRAVMDAVARAEARTEAELAAR